MSDIENENLRLWRGKHKVELLVANFKNNGDTALALVKAIGRIRLDDPVPHAIGRGKSFLVPLHELMEVPE